MHILITGAGSGIGKALAEGLSKRLKQGSLITIVGRRLAELQSTASSAPRQIQIVQADVGDPDGRSKIIDHVKKIGGLTHIIHSAASVHPISKLSEVKLDEYRAQHATNTEGPLFLTQGLLPFMHPKCRSLYISSDAAFNPYVGISSYAISKAALAMVYKSFQLEYKDKEIYFASLCPGGVETPMAKTLSDAPLSQFPDANTVRENLQKGEMQKPEIPAKFIEFVLLETSEKQFSKEWDIENENDLKMWKASMEAPCVDSADESHTSKFKCR